MTVEECRGNHTGVTIFLLMGFQMPPVLKALLFLFFLTIYIFSTTGNSLILITISTDVHLHSPMYFFLGNLSLLEIGYMTSIIPTLLGAEVDEGFRVTLLGCFTQFSIFAWLTASECFVLTAMAYVRYVAICHPLHYATLMDQQCCFRLALSAWMAGSLISMTNLLFLCMLQFPKHNEMDHYFCDLEPLFKHTCSELSQIRMEVLVLSCTAFLIPFIAIIVSYVYIISTVLKISSTKGKSRAFSTCSSHLAVVIAYFGILILAYIVQSANEFFNLSKSFSLIYTIGTPVFNPLVYTLRNKEIREGLKKTMTMVL